MKEDFLHYVWKFQKFEKETLSTTASEKLLILKPGQHNVQSGPDFFNGQVQIENQLWAGNIEIHLKSSDWYAHRHETDPAYDNVILHVVWEHDTEIYRKNNTVIPTLVLKERVDRSVLKQYLKLFSEKPKFINCENDFAAVDEFVISSWQERLFMERLQQKSELVFRELEAATNDWEALLFRLLAKNFGLKVNGGSFLSLAQSLEFSVVRKLRGEPFKFESVLYGLSGMLEQGKDDSYLNDLKDNYTFLAHKFKLEARGVIPPKFFRLRPPNFPTIRLSQLAMLYYKEPSLFSEIISAKTLDQFYDLFEVSTSKHWETHYNFGVASTKRNKRLTRDFIHLLIINTVIPLKFCYAKQVGKDVSEELVALATSLPKEENSIVKNFNLLKPIISNAFESQAMLQLKNEYCNPKKCMECAIGNSILKQ